MGTGIFLVLGILAMSGMFCVPKDVKGYAACADALIVHGDAVVGSVSAFVIALCANAWGWMAI